MSKGGRFSLVVVFTVFIELFSLTSPIKASASSLDIKYARFGDSVQDEVTATDNYGNAQTEEANSYKLKSDDKTHPSKKTGIFDKVAFPLLTNFPPTFRREFFYFLIICIGLFIWALIGYSRNYKVAYRCAKVFQPILEDVFAFVSNKPGLIEVKSWHRFRMYASGRTSCKWLLINFDLIKRECLWNKLFISVLYPTDDTITAEVRFDALDCIVFAICRRLSNKKFVGENIELTYSSAVFETKELSQEHRAYINSNGKSFVQYANFVIHNSREIVNYLISFYISDVMPDEKGSTLCPNMIVKFCIPECPEKCKKIVDFLILMIDYSKNFVLPAKVRELILKERDNRRIMLEAIEKKRNEESEGDKEPKLTPGKLKKLSAKRENKGELGRSNARIRVKMF